MTQAFVSQISLDLCTERSVWLAPAPRVDVEISKRR